MLSQKPVDFRYLHRWEGSYEGTNFQPFPTPISFDLGWPNLARQYSWGGGGAGERFFGRRGYWGCGGAVFIFNSHSCHL